jgi:hypothetical protein
VGNTRERRKDLFPAGFRDQHAAQFYTRARRFDFDLLAEVSCCFVQG